MLSDVKKRWGSHWDEGGKLENPRELVKYVCKPMDLLKLSPAELVQMKDCTHGLCFARPLGSLRDWRSYLREKRLRVSQLGGAWETIPDWNSSRNVACDIETTEQKRKEATIVAITPPAPVFAPMREPCFVVMNWDGQTPLEFNDFQQEISETALRVHTTSIIAKGSQKKTKHAQGWGKL